jgi:hypothetical protein
MMQGFDYFDGNHRENFCAGLILLCLDEDPRFRKLFADLIRHRMGLSDSIPLTDWGREVRLDIEQGECRRSDLWLRFGEERFVIEIKTRSGWTVEDVVRQVLEQSASQIQGKAVRGVALLAPYSLLRRIGNQAIRRLAWREVLDLVDKIDQPSRVLSLAQAQWRCNVEVDFGLPSSTPVSSESMRQVVSEVGCLAAFLRSTLVRLGGDTRGETLYLSRPDGQPRRKGEWGWFALSVPGQLERLGSVFIGVYTYVECPKGRESDLGMWLEMYRKDDDREPFAFIRFNPPDLTHESLAKELDAFVAAFETELKRIGTAVAAGG